MFPIVSCYISLESQTRFPFCDFYVFNIPLFKKMEATINGTYFDGASFGIILPVSLLHGESRDKHVSAYDVQCFFSIGDFKLLIQPTMESSIFSDIRFQVC